jgi:hypothetical protein
MTIYRHLFVEGSSTSHEPNAVGATVYCRSYLGHAIAPTDLVNYAGNGDGLAQILGRQSTVVGDFQDNGVNILFIQIGQNDFVSGAVYQDNESAWFPDAISLINGYKAGATAAHKLLRIGVATMNPRSDSHHNASRVIVNAAMLLWPSQGVVDFVADWGNDPTYGNDADVSDTAKYPDTIHPSQANHDNMEANYFRPAVNANPGLPAGVLRRAV